MHLGVDFEPNFEDKTTIDVNFKSLNRLKALVNTELTAMDATQKRNIRTSTRYYDARNKQ